MGFSEGGQISDFKPLKLKHESFDLQMIKYLLNG